MKSKIIAEIDRRDLKKEEKQANKLDAITKLKIIVTGTLGYRFHLEQTNKLLAAGKNKEYKHYWNYLLISLAVNTILFLLIAKYIIKPYFTK